MTQPQPEQEMKANRMLMLELTDGITVVEGMEYKPIPNLNINDLSPGTKVRLLSLQFAPQALHTLFTLL